MELFKISILCGNGTSAGCFQMIQTFSDCDLAEPGFFVGAIKTGEIFVGGKKHPVSDLRRQRDCPPISDKWKILNFGMYVSDIPDILPV